MDKDILIGIMIPFAGTTLGAAMVFFMKNEINALVQKILLGFASGVMMAASVWSLLIPAMDMKEESMGKLRFIPAVIGFFIGIFLLLAMDRLIPHIHLDINRSEEGPKSRLHKTTMMILDVSLG